MRSACIQSWLRHASAAVNERFGLLVACEFLRRDARERRNFWVDPCFAVDGLGRIAELQGEILRACEVHRAAHAVIDRAEHRHALGTKPVAHRQQLVMILDLERDVLRGARSAIRTGVAGVGCSGHGRDLGNVGIAHKRDRTLVIKTQKAMPRVLDAVHPIEGLQFHAEAVSEERNLFLDIGGADCQMMQAFNFIHVLPRTTRRPVRDYPRAPCGPIDRLSPRRCLCGTA